MRIAAWALSSLVLGLVCPASRSKTRPGVTIYIDVARRIYRHGFRGLADHRGIENALRSGVKLNHGKGNQGWVSKPLDREIYVSTCIEREGGSTRRGKTNRKLDGSARRIEFGNKGAPAVCRGRTEAGGREWKIR